MATNIFANTTQRGTLNQFQNALSDNPGVYRDHTQLIQSDAPNEQHVWLGMAPIPRELVSGRSFRGMRDWTFTLTNKEYELSVIFDQNTVEDDPHNLIKARIAEMGRVWESLKDSQFATLMEDGDGTNQGNAFDGNTFYHTTRTIGDSAAINNNVTTSIVSNIAPTIAEAKTALRDARVGFWGYQDDQGRADYTRQAMKEMRLVCDPQYEAVFTEVNEAALTAGGDSNAFYQNKLTSIDVLPFLTNSDATIRFNLTGDKNRMPFLYQERTPIQLSVFASDNDVALNHGLMVLVRQRHRLGYGEPRFSREQTFTTT